MPHDNCTLFQGVLPPFEWSILSLPLDLLSPRPLRVFKSFLQNKLSPSLLPPCLLLQSLGTFKKHLTSSRSQQSTYIQLNTLQNTCLSSSCACSHSCPCHMCVSSCILMPSMLSHPCPFYFYSLSFFPLLLVRICFPLCLPSFRG